MKQLLFFLAAFTFSAKAQINCVPCTPASILAGTIYKMCPGDTSEFHIKSVANASSYNWTLPVGLFMISGQGSTQLMVTATSVFAGGDITVQALNNCGASLIRTKYISYNTPVKPVVGGPTNDFCHHSSGHHTVYFGVKNPGAFSPHTSFYWYGVNQVIHPDSDPSTNIQAYWQSGEIGHAIAIAHNSCGVSLPGKLGFNTRPPMPNPIVGPLQVCAGDIVTYTVSNDYNHLTDFNSAVWSFVANGAEVTGVQVVSSATESTISIIWPVSTPANASVRVRELNDCNEKGPWRVLSGIQVSNSFCGLRNANNYSTDKAFNIFPNPVGDLLSVNFNSDADSIKEIRIFDTMGREILKQELKSAGESSPVQIDCQKLLQGVYTLQVSFNSGLTSHSNFLHQ